MTAEETIDRLQRAVEKLAEKMESKTAYKQPDPENLKKNSHLHLLMETSLHERLKKEAGEKGISMSELSRMKIRENVKENNPQLDRIEWKIDKIIENNKK